MTKQSIPDHLFVKSSHSQPGSIINCVEVARTDDVVAVRNSQDPSKTTTYHTHSEWKAFLAGVRGGEFEV